LANADLITDATSCYVAQAKDGTVVEIGPIASREHEELFPIFAGVVAGFEGYPHSPPLTRQSYDQTFVEPVTIVVVARIDGKVAGAYYLKPNFPGRAAHIANAGYVVAAGFRSKGLGRLLVADSIERAPVVGFDAIQFNLVFASNPARAMYRELGWQEVGVVPAAIDGEDAIIYHRFVGRAAETTGKSATEIGNREIGSSEIDNSEIDNREMKES
jgi:GNAT superfamily N-acetyltransferase